MSIKSYCHISVALQQMNVMFHWCQMLKSISRISVWYVFRAKQQPNSVISWNLCGLICHPHQVFLRLIALTSCHTWRSCRNAQTRSWVRFRYIGLSWKGHICPTSPVINPQVWVKNIRHIYVKIDQEDSITSPNWPKCPSNAGFLFMNSQMNFPRSETWAKQLIFDQF